MQITQGSIPIKETNSLCIIKLDTKITKVFATFIPNKSKETLIPIVFNQVTHHAKI